MSAANAGKLVDQFIQTQNDGKIVVAEYAQNIGKVASAAAGLGVPLSEVNAVIAQSTASGVQAEVAFTGLKGALARLASGEATKALKDFGIEINASTVEADGLLGTLEKLKGLDTGQIFKALGTEAGPALLPVIQNLERYEELILNQKQAQGTAAAAAATAAGTIEGAWKRVTVAFQNLFSDQSELGQIIRATLLAAAATVEALGAAFKILLAPIRAVIEFIGEIGSALFGLESAETVLQSLTQLWFDQISAVQNTADTIIAVGKVAGKYVGELVSTVAGWFSGLWNGISQGAQRIVGAITGAFSTAFNNAKNIIVGFYNSLPDWLKGALNAAGNVVGGVTSAVTGAIKGVVSDIQEAKAQVQITVPDVSSDLPDFKATTPVSPKTTKSGGSKGSGSKGTSRESQLPQLNQEIAAAEKLLAVERQLLEAQFEGNTEQIRALEATKLKVEYENELAAIALEKIPALEAEAKAKLAALDYSEQLLQLENQIKTEERDRLETLEERLTAFDREIELAGVKDDLAKDLLKIEHDIVDMRNQGLLVGEQEIAQYRARAQAAAQARNQGQGGKVQQYMDQLKTELADTEGMIVSLAQTVEGEIGSAMSNAITGLIDGTKTAQEAFADMFKNIGKAFIDMATQMIAKALVMKALNILLPGAGGGGGGGFFPLGGGGLSIGSPSSFGGGNLFSYSGGGYTGSGARSGGVDGQGGFPAILHPQETVVDHRGAMNRFSSGGGAGGGNPNITVQTGDVLRFNNDDYVSMADFEAGMKQAAKQGASSGYSRTMSTLKNSRSQRSKLGMR